MAHTKWIKLKGDIVGDGFHEAFKGGIGIYMIKMHALSCQRVNKPFFKK